MNMIKKLILVSSLLTLMGCASGLNSMQQREYTAFKNAGVLVEEKDPTTGALLGLLPGGGSFYARETGLGIGNLLLWPISIFWDPISGYDGAMVINYDLTKYQLKKDMDKEISALEDKLTMGQINNKQYVVAKRNIEKRFEY